jgi:predicted amidohydrolase YtcJ
MGVTSLHDMEYSSNLPVYQELLKKNKLNVRIMLYIPVRGVELLSHLKIRTPFGNNFIKIGGLKGFIDGSLGSSTALFFKPYKDDPENKGIFSQQMFPEGTMENRIVIADRNQIQVAIHAIGDKANHVVLDMFEKANAKNKEYDRRWRIEHAQHLIPEDIKRFSALNVIASVQPTHLFYDGIWAENKIGKDRCRYTYALKSLIDRGVKLVFGTDWPVVPIDPIKGIHTAVTRKTKDRTHPHGWVPKEKISLEDALRAYTINGAYAEYSENIKGSMESGKLADMVVLSKNIFKVPYKEIPEIKVNMTIFNGKIIYGAK